MSLRPFALAVPLLTIACAAPPSPTPAPERQAAPLATHERTTVRVPQRHGGVRVRGGGEALDLASDGRTVRRVDHRVADLTVSPTPTIDEAAVRARLSPRRVTALELVVLPWRPGGVLAWEADVAGVPPRRVHVDAHDGRVLADRSIAVHARGNVYAKHPIAGAPVEVELGELPPGADILSGDDLLVVSQAFGADDSPMMVRHALADQAGDFLFTPDAAAGDDAFAEVNAWWHVSRAGRFFADTFGVDPEPPTQVIVNYREAPGQPYENAFAYRDPDDGGRFVIVAGQTAETDMAYDGMVLVHEYGHPVFDLLNDINENNTYPITSDAKGFHPAPHAINEGASDYWAASMFDDPVVLAIFDEEAATSRRVDNDLRCPDDVWGEAHLDAPLVSGTLWKVRARVGKEDADAIAFDVLGRLSDSPTFDEFAARIGDAARALQGEGDLGAEDVAEIDKFLVERGLVGCGRELLMQDGVPFTANMPGAATAAALAGSDADLCDALRIMGVQIPLAFSYKTVAPDVAPERLEALEIDIGFARADGEPLGESDLQYQLLVRQGEPVGLEVLTIPFSGQEFQLPIRGVEYDVAVDGQPTAVRLTAEDLELTPGATYYMNLLALNCPLTTHTTTLRWIVAPEAEPEVEAAPEAGPEAPIEPAAEPTDDVVAEGGCASGPGAGGALATWLAALALVVGRSRQGGAPKARG
ncbi:MAG: hypothetical protein IT385_19140 [Deltaproteobacteria bacterium]|nr:hypothetical protein [Deltaproteobacteria bacterium]